MTVSSANKLVDEIAPSLKDRSSGHLTIQRTVIRRGDNTQLARVSFIEASPTKTAQPEVSEAKTEPSPAKVEAKSAPKPKPAPKKAVKKVEDK